VKAVETAATKTDAADTHDAKDTQTEGDKKHKQQRRWSDVPETSTMSKVGCLWCSSESI